MLSSRVLQGNCMQQQFQRHCLLGRPLVPVDRMALSFRVKALQAPQPIFNSNKDVLMGTKDLTNGYTVIRRRFPAIDFGGQDGTRLGMPAGAATGDAAADDDAQAPTPVAVWVEAECLSLEASLEDLVQSLGNDHYGPEMGQHMQHNMY